MRTVLTLAAIAALSASAFSQAQPAQAAPGAARPAASAPSPGRGPGARGGMGPRMGKDFTPGWAMMSTQERDEHHKRLQDAKTPEECRAVMDEHRKLMDQRAKERGMSGMRGPRRDACAGFKR